MEGSNVYRLVFSSHNNSICIVNECFRSPVACLSRYIYVGKSVDNVQQNTSVLAGFSLPAYTRLISEKEEYFNKNVLLTVHLGIWV
jgi:hypothetical protein